MFGILFVLSKFLWKLFWKFLFLLTFLILNSIFWIRGAELCIALDIFLLRIGTNLSRDWRVLEEHIACSLDGMLEDYKRENSFSRLWLTVVKKQISPFVMKEKSVIFLINYNNASNSATVMPNCSLATSEVRRPWRTRFTRPTFNPSSIPSALAVSKA